ELLGNESWRVRAEAAEALGKFVENRYNLAAGNDETSADVYAAMIDLLPDPDGFVVARALQTLKKANLATAIDPVAAGAQKHPDLAAEVVEVLSQGSNGRSKAIPHLRKFCLHPKADVRAAAITGLCNAAAEDCQKELRAAIEDMDSSVRRAAAKAFLHLLAAN